MAPRATGEKPPPLYGHTFTKVDRCRAVVFGGIPQDLKHCGTYVLDMNHWVRKCMWLSCMLAGDTAMYMHDCALAMLATWHSKEQSGLHSDMPWPIACSHMAFHIWNTPCCSKLCACTNFYVALANVAQSNNVIGCLRNNKKRCTQYYNHSISAIAGSSTFMLWITWSCLYFILNLCIFVHSTFYALSIAIDCAKLEYEILAWIFSKKIFNCV